MYRRFHLTILRVYRCLFVVKLFHYDCWNMSQVLSSRELSPQMSSMHLNVVTHAMKIILVILSLELLKCGKISINICGKIFGKLELLHNILNMFAISRSFFKNLFNHQFCRWRRVMDPGNPPLHYRLAPNLRNSLHVGLGLWQGRGMREPKV